MELRWYCDHRAVLLLESLRVRLPAIGPGPWSICQPCLADHHQHHPPHNHQPSTVTFILYAKLENGIELHLCNHARSSTLSNSTLQPC